MRLESDHEVVGTISEIKLEGNQVKLLFITMREIELPKDVFAYEQLKAVLGKRVGIFNIDGEFFIRKIKSG